MSSVTGGADWSARLERLQGEMRRRDISLVLLASENLGSFAGGHDRVGTHTPGWGIPVTLVGREGHPHVITADGEGALHLPDDHVHGMVWNSQSMVDRLRGWFPALPDRPRVAVDALSPHAHVLIAEAWPGCSFIDVTSWMAQLTLAKSDADVEVISEICERAHAAAEQGLRHGHAAMLRALDGAFLVAAPQVSGTAVALSILSQGFVAEARIGPGSPALGRAAVGAIDAGTSVEELAQRLPPGVDVVGIGRGYEAPRVVTGLGSPPDLRLETGAVLAIRWHRCGVTIRLAAPDDPAGHRYLSPPPEGVIR